MGAGGIRGVKDGKRGEEVRKEKGRWSDGMQRVGSDRVEVRKGEWKIVKLKEEGGGGGLSRGGRSRKGGKGRKMNEGRREFKGMEQGGEDTIRVGRK